jgi:hypothetical protein
MGYYFPADRLFLDGAFLALAALALARFFFSFSF